VLVAPFRQVAIDEGELGLLQRCERVFEQGALLRLQCPYTYDKENPSIHDKQYANRGPLSGNLAKAKCA